MLRGTRALVTGGSRGIGFAIAKALAEAGAAVCITGRNAATLQKAAEEIGEKTNWFVWDMADISAIGENYRAASKAHGPFDMVVNNAGIFALRSEWGPELLETTAEEWQRIMDINSSGVFFLMQAAVKDYLARGVRGNILNITSAAAHEPVYGAYGASKCVATALTRGWGKRFAPDGIVINGIAPGPVATEMNHWKPGDSLEHDRIPFGRFALSEEVASLAMQLLSREGEMLCGETVILDGGYCIR